MQNKGFYQLVKCAWSFVCCSVITNPALCWQFLKLSGYLPAKVLLTSRCDFNLPYNQNFAFCSARYLFFWMPSHTLSWVLDSLASPAYQFWSSCWLLFSLLLNSPLFTVAPKWSSLQCVWAPPCQVISWTLSTYATLPFYSLLLFQGCLDQSYKGSQVFN